MITDTFDDRSHAIINPCRKENAPEVDACIMTFSYMIEEFVLANYECEQIASFWSTTGNTPIYGINYKGKKFAFFKTYVGAPACVATVEDTLSELQTDKYIVFGGAGCLNKEIGDLLDAPEWDTRRKEGETKGTQHDTGHFDIALELARYVVE